MTDIDASDKDVLSLFSSPTRVGILYATKCIVRFLSLKANVLQGSTSVCTHEPCGVSQQHASLMHILTYIIFLPSFALISTPIL